MMNDKLVRGIENSNFDSSLSVGGATNWKLREEQVSRHPFLYTTGWQFLHSVSDTLRKAMSFFVIANEDISREHLSKEIKSARWVTKIAGRGLDKLGLSFNTIFSIYRSSGPAPAPTPCPCATSVSAWTD
jgi:hypothetical protein